MNEKSPRNLILVRHGQSWGNVIGKSVLPTSEEQAAKSMAPSLWPLTKKGQDQAKRCGEYIREEILQHTKNRLFDSYYASQYVRAMTTAALLNLPHAEWRHDLRITERHWGVHEYSEHISPDLKSILDIHEKQDPFYTPKLSGESISDTASRVQGFMGTLFREYSDGDVIVVCHGEVMRAFHFLIRRMTLSDFIEYDNSTKIKNCDIVWYRRSGDSHYNARTFTEFRHISIENSADSEWLQIRRRKLSNEGLLNEAERLTARAMKDIGNIK